MREFPIVVAAIALAIPAWVFAVLMAFIQSLANDLVPPIARAARSGKESGIAIVRYAQRLLQESTDRNNQQIKEEK